LSSRAYPWRGATQCGMTSNTSSPTQIFLTSLVIPAKAGIQSCRPSATAHPRHSRGGGTPVLPAKRDCPPSSFPRRRDSSLAGQARLPTLVIPAEAGLQSCRPSATAHPRHSRGGGNPVLPAKRDCPPSSFPRRRDSSLAGQARLPTLVIPAEAGIHSCRPSPTAHPRHSRGGGNPVLPAKRVESH
jgi:hypothetical protein